MTPSYGMSDEFTGLITVKFESAKNFQDCRYRQKQIQDAFPLCIVNIIDCALAPNESIIHIHFDEPNPPWLTMRRSMEHTLKMLNGFIEITCWTADQLEKVFPEENKS